jgi:ribosome-associated protein YbcJ (S4-like RNA binding protein)
LKEGIKRYEIALMCAEKDPAECHRTILICRYFKSEQVEIKHILEDGSIEFNNELEKRITQKLRKKLQIELSDTKEDIIQRAYDLQGERIAYVPDQNSEDV